MQRPIYQIDAFSSEVFRGNPAAVVPLDEPLPDETLQRIALENNLSETAFLTPSPEADRHIRWFTPTTEVELCGHATLAAAHAMWEELGHDGEAIRLSTERAGELRVTRSDGLINLDLPAYPLASFWRWLSIAMMTMTIHH